METADPEQVVERLVWRGHPAARASLGFLAKWGFLATLPVIITGILKLNDRGTGMAFWKWIVVSAVLIAGVLAIDTVRRALVNYVVTDRRISVRQGVVLREDGVVPVGSVTAVATTQTVAERVLGIGTIVFTVRDAGGAVDVVTFDGVAKPHELVRRFERHVPELRSLPTAE